MTSATQPRRPSRGNRRRTVAVTPISFVLSLIYGVAAAFVFVFSGSFGRFGIDPWFDTALVIVTITSSIALTYVSMLLVSYLRQSRAVEGNPDNFSWHLLIPCRDEESVIAETVSAARTSFPNVHVWVIDDASEDATASIVRKLMDFDARVHLISRVKPEARTGKGDALNAAFRIVAESIGTNPLDRERAIIGVLDADGFLSENALPLLAGEDAFGDSDIGAAQLEVWMKNRGDRKPRPSAGRWKNAMGRFLIRMQDIEFRTSNSAMQLLRIQTGTVGMGGNGQFTRVSVLDRLAEELGNPWGKKLSEDYELGLNILSFEYQNHYIRDAHVSQEALPYLRRLLTQRTRWAQGNMECIGNLPVLRRSKALSWSGFLEIHFFMAQPWLMMLNLVLIPTLFIFAIVEGRFGFLGDARTLIIVAAALVFLVLPYALWGPLYRSWAKERMSVLASLGLGAGYLVYVYFTYLYYPRAIARMLTGRKSWAKTLRNADTLVPVETTPTEVLTALPLIDLTVLDELAIELDGKTDYALEVVSQFVIVWPKRVSNLRTAVAAEDVQATRDAIASIRVSSAMLGARRLEMAANDFTALADRADFDACRAAIPTLTRVGDDTIEEIRKLFLPGTQNDGDSDTTNAAQTKGSRRSEDENDELPA
ncbi:glycosyltransferase [Humidisolicoccus flavus]|uniref:glycosyltransferase n=1 Tax=Humidisolicoccus flavus TaxID=3111414 RepID=UPI003248C0AC